MLDTALSIRLNGILELACMFSDRVGYSTAEVSAYTADGWEKAFCRHYRVRKFTPVPVRETFYESLNEWLGSEELGLAKKVVGRFTHRLGEPLKVYRAADEDKLIDRLSSCEGGIGAFYITDDVFFVAFKTHVLAFLIGNFE